MHGECCAASTVEVVSFFLTSTAGRFTVTRPATPPLETVACRTTEPLLTMALAHRTCNRQANVLPRGTYVHWQRWASLWRGLVVDRVCLRRLAKWPTCTLGGPAWSNPTWQMRRQSISKVLMISHFRAAVPWWEPIPQFCQVLLET